MQVLRLAGLLGVHVSVENNQQVANIDRSLYLAERCILVLGRSLLNWSKSGQGLKYNSHRQSQEKLVQIGQYNTINFAKVYNLASLTKFFLKCSYTTFKISSPYMCLCLVNVVNTYEAPQNKMYFIAHFKFSGLFISSPYKLA